ncbi:nucleotide-binding alpha-beta plait domain-containing protein [Tanacetum coccineum]
MGSFRTKEDDVSKISTSIYVSNFPKSFSAKDLFHSCKIYGHVVDSFIPLKRSKDGKRFGFVRFINVFNVDRLVNNLCTIWVGRLKLNANVARFRRESMKSGKSNDKTEKVIRKSNHETSLKTVGNWGSGKSFVHMVKGSNNTQETDSNPSIVLDEECVNGKDLSCALMGRVKEFSSLSNLRKVLCNEGFESLKIRIVWIDVEGIPFKFWSGPTFRRVAAKWGQLVDMEDHDDSNVYSKRLCILTKVHDNILESFKIVFRGRVYWLRANEVPGWTPDFTEEEDEDDQSVEDNIDGIQSDQDILKCNDDSEEEEVPETEFEAPDGLIGNQSDDPFGLYSHYE